jgi:adenylate cyclase
MVIASWFHVFRREAPIVLERSEAAVALGKEHGFPYHAAQSSILRGWALVHLGRELDGIAQMEAGLAARKAPGANYPPTQFLGWLAEAYGKAGQATRGLTVLEEALATVYLAGDPVFEAELHRIKGELLLIRDPRNSAEAMHCFQIAIEESARQGAKSLELRAKTSLARQLGKCKRGEEARALLSEIYRWFTEGFDTLDLKNAEALLNQLIL